MHELLEYRYAEHSHYGFIWEVESEHETEEAANLRRTELITKGKDPTNLRIREKEEIIERNSSPVFRFAKPKPRYLNMKHSDRRRMWNSDDPREVLELSRRR